MTGFTRAASPSSSSPIAEPKRPMPAQRLKTAKPRLTIHPGLRLAGMPLSRPSREPSDTAARASRSAPPAVERQADVRGAETFYRETWHVVQQKQGRVRPVKGTAGVAFNDDASLEEESDVKRAEADALSQPASTAEGGLANASSSSPVAQLMRKTGQGTKKGNGKLTLTEKKGENSSEDDGDMTEKREEEVSDETASTEGDSGEHVSSGEDEKSQEETESDVPASSSEDDDLDDLDYAPGGRSSVSRKKRSKLVGSKSDTSIKDNFKRKNKRPGIAKSTTKLAEMKWEKETGGDRKSFSASNLKQDAVHRRSYKNMQRDMNEFVQGYANHKLLDTDSPNTKSFKNEKLAENEESFTRRFDRLKSMNKANLDNTLPKLSEADAEVYENVSNRKLESLSDAVDNLRLSPENEGKQRRLEKEFNSFPANVPDYGDKTTNIKVGGRTHLHAVPVGNQVSLTPVSRVAAAYTPIKGGENVAVDESGNNLVLIDGKTASLDSFTPGSKKTLRRQLFSKTTVKSSELNSFKSSQDVESEED